MKYQFVFILIALTSAGCNVEGEAPAPVQVHREAPKFALQEDIALPALIADNGPGRSFHICEIAHRLVEAKLKVPDRKGAADFLDCIYTREEQVHYAGGGRYTISSWVDIEKPGAGPKVRIWYEGDAEDGEGRAVRITRLELKGATQ